MQAPPSPSALARATRAVWLLTLTWGGRVLRVATEPLTITDDTTGDALQFASGLAEIPAVEESADRQGVSDAGASVPMTIYLDALSIAEEVAQGRRLDSARGELSEVHLDHAGTPIQAWSQRIRHVVSGRLLLPVLAGADTAESRLDFTLEELPLSSSSTILDPLATIDDTTWPQATGDTIGKPYPVVIGAPGRFLRSDDDVGTTSGSPAYPVEFTAAAADTLLICDGEVSAGTVTVFDSDGASEVFAVSLSTDGRGRDVSVLDISGAGTISRISGTYYIGWFSSSQEEQFGILSTSGTAPLSLLGDVLQWIAARLGEGVDYPAWGSRRGEVLDTIRVDTYLNDPEQTALDLLQEIIRAVPTLAVRRGVDGLYPQTRLLDLPDDGGVASITEGGDFSPTSELTNQIEPGDIRNTYTVRFAPRAATGALRRAVTCTPERTATDATQFATEYAFSSASRYGRSAAETLEVPWIYDESSAALIAALQVRINGFPYSTRAYRADWRYGWLEVGQRVRLTSSTLHLSGVLVEVVGKAPRIGGYEFLLAFDDDPVRLGSKRAV